MKQAVLLSLVCLWHAGAQGLHETASAWADYYARVYGVPAEFVKAVIEIESGWRREVISTKGAAGLMQLTPPAAFTFGVTNRFRIDENIRGGVAYLAHLMRFASNAGLAGEQEMSSLAYNENIVITVPGNTRFFLVLLQEAGEKPDSRALPGSLRNTTQIATDGRSLIPSAQELRELIDLKAELNRIYGQAAATRISGPEQQQ